MFEDEYRLEMANIKVSDALLADTLHKMREEQASLFSEANNASLVDTPAIATQTFPGKRRNSNIIMRIGLSAAACLILVIAGAFVWNTVVPTNEAGNRQGYFFAPVTGATIKPGESSSLLLGEINDPPVQTMSGLTVKECSVGFLPDGILQAEPTDIQGKEVYLGYDATEQRYYAAFNIGEKKKVWVLIQSSETGRLPGVGDAAGTGQSSGTGDIAGSGQSSGTGGIAGTGEQDFINALLEYMMRNY